MCRALTDPDDLRPDPYHYGVIARAITAIDAAGGAPMPLEQLAADLSMSPAHFQRVFSRWAGVSPKRYQQYLTLDHARSLLAANATTLETADTVGLSGSGRLHDLFLRWEAMAPGDYARGGAGLTIRYAQIDTAFGPALAMATERGLCGLAFTADCGPEAGFADLQRRWPRATFTEDPGRVGPLALRALGIATDAAPRGVADLHLIGAPFQIKVWEALLRIPSGQVTTYSDIARAVGHPKAARAVGTAVGRNPISWLIPCHRALRKGGALGGYHWGLPVKRAMLAWEAARRDSPPPPPAGETTRPRQDVSKG
ncbi:bifunctional helix-turn-helix domain-containing protein/methylated-DNA--[protein]-cysteine S-methyltransferase [Pseudoruegeria sp. SK021]|uniref:methylated-DNA--[protein]-cysteine S-methyltransferase n=1 Tax=Pseudoruegeria sp. SK021 TaxID=1933035 RepID=UPI000A266533|nr:bifunctional helix-turn-helix domain-containing protein/methylated-DNA--[protein]-cysteine S-methyltransferase [Pseudoruegeria sp. SK021]OSP56579.1 6-O-methylguanine DNA methyltransferase [Pseudoruegeria sp. SK021]